MARNAGGFDVVSRVVFGLVLPVAKPLAKATDGLAGFLSGVAHAPSLESRNRRLEAQVRANALYAERIDLLNQQIDILRKEQGLKPIPGRERVNVDVIGFSEKDDSFILNAGNELGIQPDMPVINGEGLVGVVQTVSKGWCTAALITKYGIHIGGIDLTRKPPERGLLNGRGATMLTMFMFDPKASVATGDEIVTGGLSLHIPYGLIVGRVISVEDDPDIGMRLATVDPAVNLGLLREVQILK